MTRENLSSGFTTRSNTNRAAQPQKMARGLHEISYLGSRGVVLCSENKGVVQLRGYHAADLRLCFAYAKSRFSHDEAHIYNCSKYF